jgi:hypothetical protein
MWMDRKGYGAAEVDRLRKAMDQKTWMISRKFAELRKCLEPKQLG